ncbi:hypothetical protein SAMN06296056_1011326 [Priestia filamentosa]|nr:hypothetical protein SAMN06296056_1011326 [Priestia filamentosa]
MTILALGITEKKVRMIKKENLKFKSYPSLSFNYPVML